MPLARSAGSAHNPLTSSAAMRHILPSKGEIVYEVGGSRMPIEMKLVRSPNGALLSLFASGAIVDQEHYAFDNNDLVIKLGGGESYEPGIPIFRFPARAGDTWDWSGELKNNHGTIPATAAIRIAECPTMIGDTMMAAHETTVDLELNSPSGAKTARQLRFWYVGEMGILKREFGYAERVIIPHN